MFCTANNDNSELAICGVTGHDSRGNGQCTVVHALNYAPRASRNGVRLHLPVLAVDWHKNADFWYNVCR